MESEFLFYALKSSFILEQQKLQFSGSAQPFLDINSISKFRICVPNSKMIQRQIVQELKKELTVIESGINNANAEIEKAKEYQESLITQVVTGQLKVPTLTHEKVMH